MGLPRPQEPFQRVYSAPERPAPARRPRLLALLIAIVSFVVAAVAVFLLTPVGHEERAARTPEPSVTGDTPTADDPGTPAP
ncbi:hypothetical protein, partial [Actinomadura rubrisoli]